MAHAVFSLLLANILFGLWGALCARREIERGNRVGAVIACMVMGGYASFVTCCVLRRLHGALAISVGIFLALVGAAYLLLGL